MEKIRQYLRDHQGDMLGLLERLVNIDSGSYCKEGIDRCGAIHADELRALGFAVETIVEGERGNHVRAERPGQGQRRLFLSGHLDTVCPAGTVARRPFRADGDLAWGPGVGDMKGGTVQMLYALKALHDLGRPTPPIGVFLTGDEELGSIRGRPHIEAEARRSKSCLVMEASTAPGVIGVRRWGVGAFYLTIRGQAAHVLDPDTPGASASRELAFKILALEGLSDPVRGVKVSVNLVRGGSARQVTAWEARADIDVRVREAATMPAVEARLRAVALAPVVPGVELALEGGFSRPPMEPNPATEAFLRLATDVGREAGIAVRPIEKMGGSDGCFTAALGVATLDAMGPLCHDICGETERIEISSLVPRTLLIAGVIERLAAQA
ncbi:MAG: M20 family metallopeptidase [Candidatus Rokubacteria bacterium]|nr:M20 family metallopeptidase [Candidatus Rokubacteria bacterium]